MIASIGGFFELFSSQRLFFCTMPLPKPDNLRWAAIQMLENYARCGVNMVARGSDSIAADWPTVSSEVSPNADVANSLRASSLPLEPPGTSPKPVQSSPRPLSRLPFVPLRSATREPAAASPRPAFSTSASLNIAEAKWIGPPLSEDARIDLFCVLREQVAACRKCEELACSRTQTVFGTGALKPRVVFFGEAPGADEDKQGEPFVGAAGQLLNKIIIASQMKREDVYILNSLKCRPPGNRTPVEIEIENCRPFFEAQLDVLQPEFIVCLGAVAVRAVLQTTESVGRLRGRFHRYRKAQVLVTYHPAYLLRNEDAKKHVWDDMKLLMGAMGLKLPNA